MRDSSLRVKPAIRLQLEIRNAPLLEELRRDSLRRRLVGDVLGTVLAKLEMRPMLIRLGPRTTRTVDAARLVHFQHRARAAYESRFRGKGFNCGNDRRHAARARWFPDTLWFLRHRCSDYVKSL